jgi:hypothetical protein
MLGLFFRQGECAAPCEPDCLPCCCASPVKKCPDTDIRHRNDGGPFNCIRQVEKRMLS